MCRLIFKPENQYGRFFLNIIIQLGFTVCLFFPPTPLFDIQKKKKMVLYSMDLFAVLLCLWSLFPNSYISRPVPEKPVSLFFDFPANDNFSEFNQKFHENWIETGVDECFREFLVHRNRAALMWKRNAHRKSKRVINCHYQHLFLFSGRNPFGRLSSPWSARRKFPLVSRWRRRPSAPS